jgi:branched-chain amino acid transport system permease protein
LTNARFTVERKTRLSQVGLTAGLLGTAVLASLPLWGEAATMVTLVEFFYFLALAQMWNLLAGYGGLVSIGQQAYIGLGAYALVVMTTTFDINPFLAVALAGPIAGLVAWPSAKILFRLQGPYFAIGSWVVAEVLRLVFANLPQLGGGSGTSITAAVQEMDAWWRDAGTYWMALAIGVGSMAAVYVLLRHKHGLALTAVRDSEPASESLGVSVGKIKLFVYLFAAIGTGAIGALIFLTKLRVSPDAAFSVEWSALMIFIVVIGGVGTIEGPLIGTIIYFVLRNFLADYGTWYMIVLGVLAIAVILFLRKGLWGWAQQKFDLRLFPIQRRLRMSTDASADAQSGDRAPAPPPGRRPI